MCREQLPVWQQFYASHQNNNIEVVSVAIDAQGSEKVRPYVHRAGVTFATLVDSGNILSQMLNFKAVPNCLLLDEQGILQYQKYGGFDIRLNEYASLVDEWAECPSQHYQSSNVQEDTVVESDHYKATLDFQKGLEFYQQNNVGEALAEWRKASKREPDNWVIRKQIWAIEHPDKFYNGDVDYSWQREQIERGT